MHSLPCDDHCHICRFRSGLPALASALVLLFGLILAHFGMAQGPKGGNDDIVIFYLRGKPFTCRDLTGLSYRQGLQVVEKARKYYKPGSLPTHTHVQGKRFNPENITATNRHPLTSHYNANLESMIGSTVGAEVWKELTISYPECLRNPHKTTLSTEYFRERAQYYKTKGDTYFPFVLGNLSLQNYLKAAHSSPKIIDNLTEKDIREWKKFNERAKQKLAFDYIDLHAFPHLFNGAAAPWFVNAMKANLVAYHLRLLFDIKRDTITRKYFVKHLKKNQLLRVIIVENMPESGASSLESSLDKLVDETGCIASYGLNRLFRTYRSLDRSSRVRFGENVLSEAKLSERYGKSLGKGQRRRLLAVPTKSEPKVTSGTFVFVVGPALDAEDSDYGYSEYPAFLDFCHEILGQLLPNPMARITPGPKFKMPPMNYLSKQLIQFMPPSIVGWTLPDGFTLSGPNIYANSNYVKKFRFSGPSMIERGELAGLLGLHLLADDVSEECLEGIHRILGKPIKEVPGIRFYSRFTMNRLSREYAGLDEHDMKPWDQQHIKAFYDENQNVININIKRWFHCDLARTNADIRRQHVLLLFHEFVHAWQFQNVVPENLEEKTPSSIKDSLLEGHARWVTEEFAKEKHWDRLLARLRDQYNNMRNDSERFAYVDCYLFVKALEERKNPVGLDEIFRRGLPSALQVLYPRRYLKNMRSKTVDVSLYGRTVFGPLEKSDGPVKSTVSILEARRVLAEISASAYTIKMACEKYLGGFRFKSKSVKVMTLAFSRDKRNSVPSVIRRFSRPFGEVIYVRMMHGHRLKLPNPLASMADAWITPAWDEVNGRPAKAKDGKPLPPVMHAVFAGKYLYVRSEWKAAPTSDKDALRMLLPFIERCRKADAECAKQFKDESGDDEWD